MALSFQRFLWRWLTALPYTLRLRRIALLVLGMFAALAIPVTVFAYFPAQKNQTIHINTGQPTNPTPLQATDPNVGATTVNISGTSSSQPESGAQQSPVGYTTKVIVNGESIPVPENGTVQKTIQNDASGTSMDITVNNNNGDSSSQTNIGSSSSNINVFSNTSSASFDFNQQISTDGVTP